MSGYGIDEVLGRLFFLRIDPVTIRSAMRKAGSNFRQRSIWREVLAMDDTTAVLSGALHSIAGLTPKR